MRRVVRETWRGKETMPLVDALTPKNVLEPDGIAERAGDDARLALECMGKLLTVLVKRRVLDLDTAGKIIGEYGLEWATDDRD